MTTGCVMLRACSDDERGTLTALSPTRVRFESDYIEVELEPGPDTAATCR